MIDFLLAAENTENAENFLDRIYGIDTNFLDADFADCADCADCAEKYRHEKHKKDKEKLDTDLLMVIGDW